MLQDAPCTVMNPRRRLFPADDPDATAEQVRWEYEHLRRADVILFWFAESRSVQPIALYELGMHAARAVPLVVGADAGYPRRRDIELQLCCARPGMIVWRTLEATAAAARRLLTPRAARPGVDQ